jgi:hypothetical protein
MTKKEFLDKYGEEVVIFSYYHKFTFIFTHVLEDGGLLTVNVGGSSDSIYNMRLSTDQTSTVSELDPYTGDVLRDGLTVDAFYEI